MGYKSKIDASPATPYTSSQLGTDLDTDISYIKRSNVNNVLSKASTGTVDIIKGIERFIIDFKAIDGYVNTDIYSLLGINVITANTVVQISIKNAAGTRTAYSNITKTTGGIETYTVEYGIFKAEITVNWDEYYIFATPTVGAYVIDKQTMFLDNSRTLINGIPLINDYKNVLVNGNYANGNVFTSEVSNAYTTNSIGADGQNIRIFDNPTVVNYQQNIAVYPTSLRAGSRVAIFVDYTVNEYAHPDGNNSASISWAISYNAYIGSTTIGQLWKSGQRRKEVGILEIPVAAITGNEYNCAMYVKSYIANAQLDITIHNIMIFNLGYNSTFNLYNATKKQLEFLFTSTGYYEGSLKNAIRADIATRVLGTYENKKLVSIGDSITATLTFQPIIAQEKGLIWSALETSTGIDGHPRMGFGGSKLGAYYTSLDTGISSGPGNSIFQRAKSAKYYNPDVIILQMGGNDKPAGSAFTTDPASAIQPADYGINDEPYLGDEMDLFNNPTATPPSWAACYRGVIVTLLTDMPHVKLIVCTLHDAMQGESTLVRNQYIYQIAKEYGVPVADIYNEMGLNPLTKVYLLSDEAHPNSYGGERYAQVIMSKM